MADAEGKKQARALNTLIDACLLAPGEHPPRELAIRLPAEDVTALAERVRRRATLIARRERLHAEAILTARDALILALYASATPRGAFTAWSDGSSRQGQAAGIGGLLMDPEGRMVAHLSQPLQGLDAFAAEVAALEAVMRAAADRGAGRLRVYTDCVALLLLWLEKRADPRLEQVRKQAHRFRRFELRALPRLHNQPANRLARQALASALLARLSILGNQRSQDLTMISPNVSGKNDRIGPERPLRRRRPG